MANQNKGYKAFLDCYGPSSSALASCDVTLPIGNVQPTINEAQGFASITKTGTGAYLFTLLRRPKAMNVTYGVQCSTTAQSVVITAKSLTAGTFTVTVVGAGGSTAADPTAAITLNVQALLRLAS